MTKFLHLLPYLFLLFFLYRGLREPLYFLGIPFMMYMSNSIFADNIKFFHKPGSLDDQLLFLWLIFLWILSKLIQKKPFEVDKKPQFNIIDYSILGLIIITIVDVIVIVTDYYPFITNMLREFSTLLSLLAGYFIIKDWISSNKPEIVVNFLYSLVILNSIAAILFILHQGFHFKMYDTQEYITESIQGQEITRSFWFMPPFLFFSIIYLLVFIKKYSFLTIGLLVVNLLAIFITYTRSFVVVMVVSFLLYYILTGLKSRKLDKALKHITIYLILGILGIFLLSKILPANIAYFKARFSELTEQQFTQEQPDNLKYRFANTKAVIASMDRNKTILGMGPVTRIQTARVVEMSRANSDMVWAGVIYRWGFAGLVIFVIIYLYSSLKALNLFMKSEGFISDLALAVFLYIVSQIIGSLFSWTFLSGHGYATGLWYFAVLSWLMGYRAKVESYCQKKSYFEP